MADSLVCPTCSEELVEVDEDALRCHEDHRYTVIGLTLTTNIAALGALWKAIRALEDDAGSLHYTASRYADHYGTFAAARRREADEALLAADLLRTHAKRAQERLDALPGAPSTIRDRRQ